MTATQTTTEPTTKAATTPTWDGPGLYDNIPEADYHSGTFGPTGGSLSSTEANRITIAPALYQAVRTTPAEPNPVFDLGHVAHALVLGVGLPLHIHDHDSLRTKAAREEVAAARTEGKIPVSRTDYEQMVALADTVLTHPTASQLLTGGRPEVSAYATDPTTGTTMRGRFDYYHDSWDGNGPLIVDLKTTTSAIPADFTRSVTSYGYDLQAEWYRTIHQLTTGTRPDFIHVVVEKKPPYLLSVIRLGPLFTTTGATKVRAALDTYSTCTHTGTWPGLDEHVTTIDAPHWYTDLTLKATA